jgi:hypothetical protein
MVRTGERPLGQVKERYEGSAQQCARSKKMGKPVRKT